MSDEGEWQTAGTKPKKSKEELQRLKENAEKSKRAMQAYYDSFEPKKPKVSEEKKGEADQIVGSNRPRLAGKPKPKATTSEMTKAEQDEERSGSRVRFISFEQKTKLIRLREQKGLTRKEAARRVQVAQNVYDGYENGTAVFDNTIFTKILHGLERLPNRTFEKE